MTRRNTSNEQQNTITSNNVNNVLFQLEWHMLMPRFANVSSAMEYTLIIRKQQHRVQCHICNMNLFCNKEQATYQQCQNFHYITLLTVLLAIIIQLLAGLYPIMVKWSWWLKLN